MSQVDEKIKEIEEWRNVDDKKPIREKYWQALVYIDYLVSVNQSLESQLDEQDKSLMKLQMIIRKKDDLIRELLSDKKSHHN